MSRGVTTDSSFPKNVMRDTGQRGRLRNNEQFAPLMAVYLLRKHQIFMLAIAGLRVEGEVAQVLVVPQPPP